MKRIRQLRVLILQVIISLFFLNTQISFAQNLNKWNEGTYLGLSLVFNNIKEGDSFTTNLGTGNSYSYGSDREMSKGIKVGYNKMLTNNIFVGPEFFYSTEKTLNFDDAGKGGRVDHLTFKNNYTIGLKAGYAMDNNIAYVFGLGKAFQKVQSSFSDDTPEDNNGGDVQTNNLKGSYINFGILFNFGNGYNLEFLSQKNKFEDRFNKPDTPSDRNIHDITVKENKSYSITINKFF
jgi:hypothetical protein